MQDEIVDADRVIEAERSRIQERRRLAKLAEGTPATDAVALALSGGGIRSATFNLGVLQALQRHGMLKRVDYLSTASGGGYIGTTVTWLMSRLGQEFPFGTRRTDYATEGGELLRWLRRHGDYLTPGGGLDRLSFAGFVLLGTIANLAITLPVLFALVYALIQPVFPHAPAWFLPEHLHEVHPHTGAAWLTAISVWVALVFVASSVLYALLSSVRFHRAFGVRRWAARTSGRLLQSGLAAFLIGSLPLVHHLMADYREEISTSLFGVGGALVSLTQRGNAGQEGSSKRLGKLVPYAMVILVYGLFLVLFLLAAEYAPPGRVVFAAGVAGLGVGFLANVNHVSIHRYYRDRLMEAYMPPNENVDRDSCRLRDIAQTFAPYHLINAKMITTGSQDNKLRARGGDSFLFSPLYCGAASTGYAPTTRYAGGDFDLATAMSISGAALATNTGNARSRGLSLILSLLNLRLGYWAPNPNPSLMRKFRPPWHAYLLREALGLRLDERRPFVNLSDGGYFDNLALYELLRRRCSRIVVCDASEDSDWTFDSLSQVIEKARVDFGIDVSIEPRLLVPKGDDGLSAYPAVVGTIRFPEENAPEGKLVYLRACMIDGLPPDVVGFKKANEAFPNDATSDQFFDELQFEAYRELGFRLVDEVFGRYRRADGSDGLSELDAVIGEIAERWRSLQAESRTDNQETKSWIASARSSS